MLVYCVNTFYVLYTFSLPHFKSTNLSASTTYNSALHNSSLSSHTLRNSYATTLIKHKDNTNNSL